MAGRELSEMTGRELSETIDRRFSEMFARQPDDKLVGGAEEAGLPSERSWVETQPLS